MQKNPPVINKISNFKIKISDSVMLRHTKARGKKKNQ